MLPPFMYVPLADGEFYVLVAVFELRDGLMNFFLRTIFKDLNTSL